MRRLVIFAFLSTTSLSACGDSGAEGLAPTLTHVQAEVFDKSCNNFRACHQGNSPAGELNLEAPARAKLSRASVQRTDKPLVAPGDPDGSFLMDKLLGRDLPTDVPGGSRRMPESSPPLEAERLELVRAWIAAGALED